MNNGHDHLILHLTKTLACFIYNTFMWTLVIAILSYYIMINHMTYYYKKLKVLPTKEEGTDVKNHM